MERGDRQKDVTLPYHVQLMPGSVGIFLQTRGMLAAQPAALPQREHWLGGGTGCSPGVPSRARDCSDRTARSSKRCT